MKDPDLTFLIPTYRLRDVAAMVDAYDEHFWRNGHDVRIVIFDDGNLANRNNSYGLLEGNATYNPVYYVGPQEKERLVAHVATRVRRAVESYRRAVEAQRAGDWARYGDELTRLGEMLRQLQEAAGAGRP